MIRVVHTLYEYAGSCAIVVVAPPGETAIPTCSDSKLARLFLVALLVIKALVDIIVPGNKHTDHRDSGAGRPRATGMIRALPPVSR